MSLHRYLVQMLTWLLAPLAIGSAVLVLAIWNREHAKVDQGLRSMTTAVVHALDLHHEHHLSQLEAIAALPAVAADDFAQIHSYATELLADHPSASIGLVRADGQLLLSTLVPFGTQLPNVWAIEERESAAIFNGSPLPLSSQGMTREVFRTGEASNSNLYLGLSRPAPRLAMAIPVRRDAAVVYALTLSYPAAHLEAVLRNKGLPTDARAVLLDGRGAVVATNGVGPYAVATELDFPAARIEAQNVHWDEPDGTSVVGMRAGTKHGYTMTVSLPRMDAYRTAFFATVGWAVVFLATLILSIRGAARLNRRVTEPLERLASGALERRLPAGRLSNIHEIDLLAGALEAAVRTEALQREEHRRLVQAQAHEQLLQAGQAQMRRVVESLYMAVAVLDLQGRVVEMNRAPPQRAGAPRQSPAGQFFWDCYWWSHDSAVQELVRRSVAEARGGQVLRYNVPACLEGGPPAMVDFQLAPLADVTGSVTRLIACAVDVQDRVDAIRSLQSREAQARELARLLDQKRWLLDATLEATPAGMVLSDGSGRLLRMNEAHRRLWGDAAPLSTSIDDYAAWNGWWAQGQPRAGERLEAGEWPLARALNDRCPQCSIVDIEPFGTPGVRKTVQVCAAPVLDERGCVVGGVMVQTDITDRVRAEAALREADRHKDEFLATLGHELRNPLGPIRSAIHIIRRYAIADPAVVRARDVIHRQTAHMARLVDDLLDMSRISRGTIKMDRKVLALQDLMAAAVDSVAPEMDAAGVRFRREFAAEPLYVDGDATRLSQALINLLSNARKFTPAGGEVILRLRKEDALAAIEVQDSGIGLAPESLDRIFGLFVQEQPSGAAGNSGLGIGLALSRSLMAMHGGQLEATSPGIGHGSTFIARLPLVAAPAPRPVLPIATKPGPPLKRPRLLVVDDNRDACDMLKELLEFSGFDASTAYDGASAFAAAQQTAPDALLLDIGLPDMNGYELCRRIRGEVGAKPVMIALTGWGQPQDKQAAQDAGFDAHVTKPADPDVLCETLTGLLERRKEACAGGRSPGAARSPGGNQFTAQAASRSP